MVRVYLLVQAKPGKIGRVRQSLESLPEVSELHPIAGPYDVIACAEANHARDLRRMLDERVRTITGVMRVMPCYPSSTPI